jgi:hypothetical protein
VRNIGLWASSLCLSHSNLSILEDEKEEEEEEKEKK